MNVLKNISKRNLIINRKRTIATLIGIVLSTALIAVVLSMFFIIQNTFLKNSIEKSGYFHISLLGLEQKDIEDLELDKDIADILKVYEVGNTRYYYNRELNPYNYLEYDILSLDFETFKKLGGKVKEGTFPTAENEILLPAVFIRRGYELGGDIEFEVETRNDDDDIIVQHKTYKIVGINSDDGPSGLITSKSISNCIDAYIILDNPWNYKSDIDEILGTNDYRKEQSRKYSNYFLNEEILMYEVFAFSDRTSTFLKIMTSIIIFIIVSVSISSIKNSFAISLNEQKRTYGMLSSIGATSDQLKKLVRLEARYYSLIGITLGNILGLFAAYLLSIIVNRIHLSGAFLNESVQIYYKFTLWPAVFSSLLSLIVIHFSSKTGILVAAKATPLQNIRHSENGHPQNIKVPKYIVSIFKIGGALAYKNLKTSRQKYKVTVISLIVSISSFIVASAFINNVINSFKDEYALIDYNAIVYFPDFDDYNREITVEPENIAQGEEYAALYKEYAERGVLYSLTDKSKILYEEMGNDGRCIKIDRNFTCLKNGYSVSVKFLIYDDDFFKRYSQKIGENYENLKDKAIVINRTADRRYENKTVYTQVSDYRKGDDITLISYWDDNPDLEYEVGAVVQKIIPPLTNDHFYNNEFLVMVDKDYYRGNAVLHLDKMFFEANDPEELTERINAHYPFHAVNIALEKEMGKTIIAIISLFSYGFIAIVTFIGLSSVFNTINSNIESRRREFAMLKSIGMTKEQFDHMVVSEALFYSFYSLLYGILIGVILSYGIHLMFSKVIDLGYVFPLKPIFISVIFVFLIVLVIMRYSLKLTDRYNIIETIRKETI